MKMTIEEQLSAYGQVLTGEETALDLVKLQRIQYLKEKLRRKLDIIPLGDSKDLITDLTKGTILGWAIQRGIVTDPAVLARFDAAVTAQVEFYGGAEFIVGMLEANAVKLGGWMAKYYAAKVGILAAATEDDARMVDIEDVPVEQFNP